MPWLEAWVGRLSGPFLLGNDMTMQMELGVAFRMLCSLKIRVLRSAKLHTAFRSSYKDRKLKLPRPGAQRLTFHPSRRLQKPRQASASVPCCPHPSRAPGSNKEHTSWKLEQTPAISFACQGQLPQDQACGRQNNAPQSGPCPNPQNL